MYSLSSRTAVLRLERHRDTIRHNGWYRQMNTVVHETCSLPQILKYVPLKINFLLKMKYIILL